jgi:alkanesulfonate monooxygenase SsuD/methylene tetrahydromethanopterin reductase-like flavin-dependent oxidoreductase (luciferase family)
MEQVVSIMAAATATTTLKLGTGVCLVNQRDPIQNAKPIASLDQVPAGRFLFGVGWNNDEMENYSTAFEPRAKLPRERIDAMT